MHTRKLASSTAIAAFLVMAWAGWATVANAQSTFLLPELGIAPAKAEVPAEKETLPAAEAPPLPNRRAENAELLRLAQRRLDTGEATESTTAQEVALYKTVEAVLAQHEAVDRQVEELKKRQGELESQIRLTRSAAVDRKTPYSFVEFDRLKDELAAEEARANLAADRLSAAKAALERSQKALAKSEAKLREAEEEYVAGKEGQEAAALSTAFEQARQALSLAKETVTLRGKEVARGELSQSVQRQAVELKREQVVRAAPRVVFFEADLHEQIAQIAKQEEAANAALATAQTRRQAADERVRNAQRQVDEAVDDREALTERLAARRREQERWSDEVDLLTQQLARLAQLRLAWDRRHAIASPERDDDLKPSAEDLSVWQREAKSTLDELVQEASARIQRMEDLRNDLTTVADRAEAAKDGAVAVVTSINEQSSQLDAMLRSQQASLVQIESTRRVYLKLREEMGENPLSPTRLAAGALAQVNSFWNTELFSVGEGPNKEYVRMNRAVAGVAVLIIGWLCSRLVSRLFANRFLKRFRLSKDADAILRSIVYYSLVFIVLLVALNTIRVKLTAFTIMGGALAIGVGFGSQTMITNFIGGLIMLAERPIRLGEQIKVGGFEGVVDEVGFRSTKLRTPNDHLVTIPNSTLVNDSIENVARRRTIRRLLNVTVSHETPRQKLVAVVEAIRALLEEKGIRERIHPIVGFEEFPPRVFFNDYNAASFNIQIVYWYAPPDWWEYMDHSERVNLRIMEEFERLGVEFAFPSNRIQVTTEPRSKIAERFLSKDGGQRHVA